LIAKAISAHSRAGGTATLVSLGPARTPSLSNVIDCVNVVALSDVGAGAS